MWLPYSDQSVRACVCPSGLKEMNKSILQYLGIIHSPNLHKLFILT